MSGELVQLREGRAMLERARQTGEIRELKRIHDLAAAARRFAEAQQLGEDARRYASELSLDAKRYLGEVLAKQEKNSGGKPSEIAVIRGDRNKNAPKLADLGITKKQSADAQKLAAISEDEWEQFKTSTQTDTLTTKRALRVAREKEAAQRREEKAEVAVLPSGVEIRHGDFREVLADLAGQVDAIVTDPPYPAEFIEEFEGLGELAARILKPDGLLVAMVGQTHLPAYIERLSQHLRYRWCGAYLTDGPATRIHGRKVGTKWKPLLIYGGSEFITQDVFTSSGDDKRHHHWGQSESGFADIIERLTEPGQLVVDPFLGGGTTALVCRDLGRRFIGCDVDNDAIAKSMERVAA